MHHAPVAMHHLRGIDAPLSAVNVHFFGGIFTQNAEFADRGSGGINFDGDWIYYGAAGAEPSGFSKPDFPLTRMKLDGSEQSEIAADDASYIYIYDDMIYFVSLQFSMEAGLALAINKVK